MRYFSYNESYSETGDERDTIEEVVTITEEDIRGGHWDRWYERMCKEYGQEHVDATYTFEDCLAEWVFFMGAWESSFEEWDSK